MNTDEVLKGLARESVKQGENLRSAVRELTLNALKGRELTVREIRRVVKAVTEGVNLGATTARIDADQVLGEAFAGMDEALLKAVQANHLALQQLSAQGQSLRDTHLKKALTELERLEDEFVGAVKEATRKGSRQLRDQWSTVLQQRTETAAEVERTLEEFGDRVHEAVKQQRRNALKAAEVMAENFTTLASGILIGLTEGLQQGKQPPGEKASK